MEENLIQRVRDAALEPPSSRTSIAAFLMREGSDVSRLSMAEVADLTFTSKPSLVRFAKAMGYSGWRDFRTAFVACVRERERMDIALANVDPNHPFGPDDDSLTVARNIAALERQAILEAAVLLDVNVLEEAARRILKASNVVLFGAEPNNCLGELFALKIRQIGVSCRVPTEDEWEAEVRGLRPTDCAMIVSYSGIGPQRPPVNLVIPLARAGVPIVVITNSGDNWLREQCDCVLSFKPREHYVSKISGFFSEQSVGFILDMLYSVVFKANYRRSEVMRLRAIVANERWINHRLQDILPE